LAVGSIIALIGTITAATTLLQAGNGLLQALLPLRMQAEGLSISAIGLVAGAYGLGFSTGCVLAPGFIRRVGYIRAFASLAAIASVVILCFTQAHETWQWVLLRALSGVTLACIFTATDGWISAQAASTHRGRTLSIYTTCTKVTLMLAPLGIVLGEVRSDGLFMTVAALMSLSLIPISATLTKEPPAPRGVRIRIRSLLAVAPSAVVAAFAIGLVNGPVMAITPVFGTSIGLSQDQAAALLFALQAGSLSLQWPLGWLSDHFDRRYVICGLAGGAACLSVVILYASTHFAPIYIILCFALWGGTALCVYSVCVAHACDLVEPGDIVSTVGSLLFSWAAGVTIGPLLGAFAMAQLGPGGLFIFSGSVMLLLTIFIGGRIWWQSRPSNRGGFVDVAPVTPATALMTPRADNEVKPAPQLVAANTAADAP
jgi:MFS family permease